MNALIIVDQGQAALHLHET